MINTNLKPTKKDYFKVFFAINNPYLYDALYAFKRHNSAPLSVRILKLTRLNIKGVVAFISLGGFLGFFMEYAEAIHKWIITSATYEQLYLSVWKLPLEWSYAIVTYIVLFIIIRISFRASVYVYFFITVPFVVLFTLPRTIKAYLRGNYKQQTVRYLYDLHEKPKSQTYHDDSVAVMMFYSTLADCRKPAKLEAWEFY